MQGIDRTANALGLPRQVERLLQVRSRDCGVIVSRDIREAAPAGLGHRVVIGQIEQNAPADTGLQARLMCSGMHGIEPAKAAADYADAIRVDLRSLLEPIQNPGGEAMKIGPHLCLKIHLSLARTIECAGRQTTRKTMVLEQIAFLFGALEATENDNRRDATIARWGRSQIPRNGETLERNIEALRRRRKERRGLLVQLDFAPLPGFAIFRIVKPEELGIVIGEARLPEQLAGTLPAPLLKRRARKRLISVPAIGPEWVPIIPARELFPRRRHVAGGDSISYQPDAIGAPDMLENRVAHGPTQIQ